MNAPLWVLYEAKYDREPMTIPWSMARHAKKYSIDVEVLFIEYFSINGNLLCYKGNRKDTLPRLVLMRGYNLELAEHFEAMGVRVINSAFAMKSCKDKLLTDSILRNAGGLPLITTIYADGRTFDELASMLGCPFVLKDRFGQQGRDVFLIENARQLAQTCNIATHFIAQPFVASSYGADVRIYVIGEKPVAAVKRFSNSDFRSNVSIGGGFELFNASAELFNQAVRIARILHGEIIAVDFLFGKGSDFIFCEANTNAGLKAYNRLGFPMTSIIMDYVCTRDCLKQ